MHRSLLTLGVLAGLSGPMTHAADPPTPPTAVPPTPPAPDAPTAWPALPRAVASFGAARLGGAIYAYGGSTGSAHGYDDEHQEHTLRRLDLGKPTAWADVLEGPKLQGNALVAVEGPGAAGGRLVLLGGFTAVNKPGDESDLRSQAVARSWSPGATAWTDLPDLPEPRSSFDAAAIGTTVYVVGGWNLRGTSDEAAWHETAWRLDLAQATPAWRAIAAPPAVRRAVALVAHEGRLYLLGGMTPEGSPTTRVDVYDPATDAWSDGPAIPGEPMEGFGAAGCVVDGRLVATTLHGKTLTLAGDGTTWREGPAVEPARFFHRMLPVDGGRAVLIGGASMSVGKFAAATVVAVPRPADGTGPTP